MRSVTWSNPFWAMQVNHHTNWSDIGLTACVKLATLKHPYIYIWFKQAWRVCWLTDSCQSLNAFLRISCKPYSWLCVSIFVGWSQETGGLHHVPELGLHQTRDGGKKSVVREEHAESRQLLHHQRLVSDLDACLLHQTHAERWDTSTCIITQSHSVSFSPSFPLLSLFLYQKDHKQKKQSWQVSVRNQFTAVLWHVSDWNCILKVDFIQEWIKFMMISGFYIK